MMESTLQRQSLERQAYAARGRLVRIIGELQYRRERIIDRVHRVERSAAVVLAIAVGGGIVSVSYFMLRRRRNRAWVVLERSEPRRHPFRDVLLLGAVGALGCLSRAASMKAQPRLEARALRAFPEGLESHDRPHL